MNEYEKVVQKIKNTNFLKRTFKEYYEKNEIEAPIGVEKKEFGFMFFDKFVSRHKNFLDEKCLKKYIKEFAPSDCFFSTAYYEDPGNKDMEEKIWKGADLVFDLDLERIEEEGEEGEDRIKIYCSKLEKIKKDCIKLVDSFILKDFGFNKGEIEIIFSGRKGYHVHVLNEAVKDLKTKERKEIADYVVGNGLDFDSFFRKRFFKKKSKNKLFNKKEVDYEIPNEYSKGWELRIREGLKKLFDYILKENEEDVKKKYECLSKLKNLINLRENIKKNKNIILKNNNMFCLGSVNIQEKIIETIKKDVLKELSVNIDVPVTTDIKRLIRLPSSIHGKSGLKVIKLNRENIEKFNPLNDAVPIDILDEWVEIKTKDNKEYEVEIQNKKYKICGKEEVPEKVAVFLLGQKVIDIC